MKKIEDKKDKDKEKPRDKWTPFDFYYLTKQYFQRLGKNRVVGMDNLGVFFYFLIQKIR